MTFTPIRNDRLSDKAAQQLLSKIRSGELPAGTRLPNESELAEQLGISRGIIREALTMLQAQGIVRRKTKEGTFVSDDFHSKLINQSNSDVLRKASYLDLIEYREAIETKMVTLVIERATDEEIEELAETAERIAYDEKNQRDIDRYFHYKIAALSKNPFFMNFIDSFYDLINEIAVAGYSDPQRREQILVEHQAIISKILARDSDAAVSSVIHHMRMIKETARKGAHGL